MFDEDCVLMCLIMDEIDWIVKLVDCMEVFLDEWLIECELVNIYVVFDYVKWLLDSGFVCGK